MLASRIYDSVVQHAPHPEDLQPDLAEVLQELEANGIAEWQLSKDTRGYTVSARVYGGRGVRWQRSHGSTPTNAIVELLTQFARLRPDYRGYKQCQVCHGNLTLDQGLGWVHYGGGSSVLQCWRCGHQSAPDPVPSACPMCGERKGWKLDHSAVPDHR